MIAIEWVYAEIIGDYQEDVGPFLGLEGTRED
jgi:hypothetical protein